MASTAGWVPAPLPYNEAERLRVLKSYCVLDSDPEPGFDYLTRLAAELFRVPIVLVSLIDEHRQFFKSAIGIDLRESPRDTSFCAYSILGNEPLVVLDAQENERFRTNPFVIGEPNIRFYAGAPLVGRDGMMLGGFSIIDQKPRLEFSERERECLKQFAALTVLIMENRLYPERLSRIGDEIVRANERFKLATQAATEGIWDWDCVHDSLYLSARARAIVGEEPVDCYVGIEDWMNRIHPSDRARVSTISDLYATKALSFYAEYRVSHTDGRWRWIANRSIAVRNSEGEPIRLVGAMVDITERKTVDVLTGLATRTHLLEHLERLMEAGSPAEDNFAVYAINLDSFKLLNSGLGRAAGDRVLQEVGLRLSKRASVHPDSIAARLSADEFALILGGKRNEQEALRVAEELSALLGSSIGLDDKRISLSVSIGLAMRSHPCDGASDLLQCAEIALGEAKLHGGGNRLVFSETMRHGMLRQLELSSALHNAISNEELEVYYQPKLHLPSRKVIGFEALVRWHHPKFGMISAEEFISIAEQFDLIVELGTLVLTRSIEQLAQWRENGLVDEEVSMAVNLSALQLVDKRLGRMLRELTQKYRVPPQCISLEVTEGVLIDDTERANEILEELKSTGILLDLDDFGTGYSSLSYLQRFPFDGLKVDRSFVMNMLDSREKAALVRSIIALAHALHLNVIAEGIETAEQLDLLREMGCEYGQGYLFSRPLPASGMDTFLATALTA
ncbi:bifunctional diguanylate cyclase/phosphodiesterase [Terriglobus sp. TAA 43]|uniref:putative bifunctional diguanylate cyclase/phosphodiesterase n=1 Tax=Terriglobus sp. TAA 43 TaxID=278961 RepID=UPI000646D225|nr:EAL domain-containing protein [Terriglobus sp. TAA 43]